MIYNLTPSYNVYNDSETYQRPSEWLTLPDVDQVGYNGFIGLFPVYKYYTNFLTIQCTGAFSVQLGEGKTPTYHAGGTSSQWGLVYEDYPEQVETLMGYKQTIIKVEGTSGPITSINLSQKYYQEYNSYGIGLLPWLDIKICGYNVTSFRLGTFPSNNQSSVFLHLEIFDYQYTNKISDFNSFFAQSFRLKKVVNIDTSYGINFSKMFRGCTNLITIPKLNTSNGTDFSTMFGYCYRLKTIPPLNTNKGVNFYEMFFSCSSLVGINQIDTSNGINFSYMFYYCYSLKTIPYLNTSKGINFSGMFQYCYSIDLIPTIDTSNGTNFTNMFNNCYTLKSVPVLNVSKGTDFTGIFNNCYALTNGRLNGTKVNISYSGCNLSASALNDIYDGLGVVTGKTITVSGNWGVYNHNPLIATAKGWSVIN